VRTSNCSRRTSRSASAAESDHGWQRRSALRCRRSHRWPDRAHGDQKPSGGCGCSERPWHQSCQTAFKKSSRHIPECEVGVAPAASIFLPLGFKPWGPASSSAPRFHALTNQGRFPREAALYTHLMIDATTPAPTVRPPSRMAKRRPWSMAIGAISLTVSCTLSPGITISVPSGSSTVPVTSVVRK
jgi:hypothetical protein